MAVEQESSAFESATQSSGPEDADYDQLHAMAKAHLGKIFHFSEDSLTDTEWPQEDCALFTTSADKFPALESLKAELNEVKSRLNRLPLTAWHRFITPSLCLISCYQLFQHFRHTKNANPAADVAARIKHNGYPELLTQAWCKVRMLWDVACPISEHPISLEFSLLTYCSNHVVAAKYRFLLAILDYITLVDLCKTFVGVLVKI
jgi:hypothetical protein